MPYKQGHGDDQPDTGVSDASVREGFEPLTTNTRALFVTMAITVVVAGFMFWGLFALLEQYMRDDRRADLPRSAAPALTAVPASPLQPMPQHNDLDWQDLVHLRQQEDQKFRGRGWGIDSETGQAVIPEAVAAVVRERYAGGAPAADLRFPPTEAPVRAGATEPLRRADVFPPVGPAAAADQLKTSEYRPATGPSDVKGLPTQSGPPDSHNNPTAVPRP